VTITVGAALGLIARGVTGGKVAFEAVFSLTLLLGLFATPLVVWSCIRHDLRDWCRADTPPKWVRQVWGIGGFVYGGAIGGCIGGVVLPMWLLKGNDGVVYLLPVTGLVGFGVGSVVVRHRALSIVASWWNTRPEDRVTGGKRTRL